MSKMSIIIRNTHFAVTIKPTPEINSIIKSFNSNLITYQTQYMPHLRRVVKREDRRYYYQVNKTTYHYSIHLLRTFIKRCLARGLVQDDIELISDKKYTPGINTTVMNPKYTDRDHQPLYIEHALKTNPISLIDLKTGKGKTYISMRVATETKYPTGVIVLSRYIDKWIIDIKELTTATDDDIYVVKGKDSLLKLLESGKKYNYVIFSQSTLRNYIKVYDEGVDGYTVSPECLFGELGLGMMLTDEVHQSFHAGYMIAIRLNVLKLLSLSATLDTLNHSIRAMYNTLYPKEVRCGDLVVFDNYVDVTAVNYRVSNPERVQCKGPKGYSHTLFEQWLLRNSVFRTAYLEMILNYVEKGYYFRKRPGDKMLILVQTIRMATLIKCMLDSKFKDLKVNRYVEEDPYENIMEADITVSTNGSAGTALDIPNLITVLQTVSIRSLQANIQALGRLREIKDVSVRYYYTYSSDIPSQRDMDLDRRDLIKPLASTYTYTEHPKLFRC